MRISAVVARRYPRILFTRQQIGDLTGIDNSTLNYWMREGVLRPTEGGEGRGSHRQFQFTEINIAGILNEIRQFGVGLPALKGLAERFHYAIDWMINKGISLDRLATFEEVALDRQRFLEDGYFSVDAEVQKKVRPDQEIEVHGSGQFAQARLSWEEAVEFHILPFLTEHDFADRAKVFEIVGSFSEKDWAEYNILRPYHYEATRINKQGSDYFEPTYFFRKEDGDWVMTSNDSFRRISAIAIDLDQVNFQIWSRL